MNEANRAGHFSSGDDVVERLASVGYLADPTIGLTVFIADRLEKPVLLEGPAGVGKTELARSVAMVTGSRLIRLQCYEGIDESKALYEWNYKKQLLRIQADERRDAWSELEEDIFSEPFLLPRPLLAAIRADEPVVLLIDEIDRVEVEAEALMLEILADFQVTIPELGTVVATRRPMVFLTSNDSRDLSEALKRRCLYLHIGYPSPERERDTERHAGTGHRERALVHHRQHIARRRAERHADANLAGTARNGVRQQAVEPDGGKQRPERAEETGQHRDQAFGNHRRVHLVGHRRHPGDGDGRQHLANQAAHVAGDRLRPHVRPQRELM